MSEIMSNTETAGQTTSSAPDSFDLKSQSHGTGDTQNTGEVDLRPICPQPEGQDGIAAEGEGDRSHIGSDTYQVIQGKLPNTQSPDCGLVAECSTANISDKSLPADQKDDEQALCDEAVVDCSNITPENLELDKTSAPDVKRFKPFPMNALPELLRIFVAACAASLGCSPEFIIPALLAAVGSSIGATRRIILKSDWKEPTVVWAATVSESGTQKTPAQNLVLLFLRQVQDAKMLEFQTSQKLYKSQHDQWKTDVRNWAKSGRRKGAPMPAEPQIPSLGRYVVSDITIPALIQVLRTSPRGVLCACDELATWLLSLNNFSSDASKWLSFHSAGTLNCDRKTGSNKTTVIPYAAVSLCGGIQPETFVKIVKSYFYLDNGLLPRFLIVNPPSKKKRWSDFVVSDEITNQMKLLFDRLLDLQFSSDSNEQMAPVDIPLSTEAKEEWIEFYNDYAIGQSNADGIMAAVLSKHEGYAARFALIHHLVRCATDDSSVNPDEVDTASMKAGIAMAKWFTYEAERVYKLFSESDRDHLRRKLIEWIERKGGSVTVRDVQQGIRRFQTSMETEMALKELVDAGIGHWEQVGSTLQGGRSKQLFVLNPVDDTDKTPLKPKTGGP